MATTDQVRAIVRPLAAERGLDLYDVEHHQASLRVLVDREGGVDIDALTDLSRAVSRALDEVDPVPGRYTLEVSSPGLERPLRRPEHFMGAVGQRVTVKTVAGSEGERRLTGVLAAADQTSLTLTPDEGDERTLGYDEIAGARTLFDWEATKQPKSTTKKKQSRA
jgi:ribosome maturation factor RimP